jgi:hypothetical protein
MRFLVVAQDSTDVYIDRLDDSSFVAYISSSYIHFQSEEADLNWQWAACVQSVFNIFDMVISQREIVESFNSLKSDRLLTPDVVSIIDNWQIGTRTMRAKMDTVSMETIKHNLALGRPVIVLYKENENVLEPCMLTAFFYHTMGSIDIPNKIVVRHAEKPESESRVEYTWNEFISSFSNQLIYINF